MLKKFCINPDIEQPTKAGSHTHITCNTADNYTIKHLTEADQTPQ